MIYIIHAKGTKYVKIGVAIDPIKRMATHQISCPHELQIIAIADWPHHQENAIHNQLVRAWVRGEWFKMTGEVNSLIATMNGGGCIADWANVLQQIPTITISHAKRRANRRKMKQSTIA